MIELDSLLNIIEFHKQVSKLKTLIRRGWELKGIPYPESVADHVFGVAILSLIYAKKLGLEIEKAVNMALIHEIGETIIGDITPSDGVTCDEKRKNEEQAVAEILAHIDDDGSLFELWKDFEYQRNPEGRLVKELDKLEMAMQAYNYETETDIPLDEFFIYVEKRLETNELIGTLAEIQKKRGQKPLP
jgi:putative hydrolase of HD superfamily